MQTKVSISNQILPDSAYQPALYFAHCGANLLSYQWHFFKERGDFLETRPHATSIAYYRIGACCPGCCFNTDAREDVWRAWLEIKTAHLCCLYVICKLRVFSVGVFTWERERMFGSHSWAVGCLLGSAGQRSVLASLEWSHRINHSAAAEEDVPQLPEDLRLCFSASRGWGTR